MNLNERLAVLPTNAPALWRLNACGVTRSATPIPLLLPHAIELPAANQLQLLLIGGLSGRAADVELAVQVVEAYGMATPLFRRMIALSALPCGNPDGLALGLAPENGVGGNPSLGYPPVGNFFNDSHNPEARYLWRWVNYHAPDLVWEVRAGESVRWEASDALFLHVPALCAAVQPTRLAADDSLLGALAGDDPGVPAPIPALRLTCPIDELAMVLPQLWPHLAAPAPLKRSAARLLLESRAARAPRTVAHVLATAYGHQLDPVVYTQGVAISGRLRLAALDGVAADSTPGPISDIVALVEPYVAGTKSLFGGQDGGANLAGLVWADELAAATADPRYADLLVNTANRYRSTHDSAVPIPSDLDYRVEDMFFSATMLGRAFQLTGDADYLQILSQFLLKAKVQQTNGLFWHARSTPYYWGRGNGFAALGFAEALTYLPENHPDRPALLTMHLTHLNALRPYQQPSGLWRQLIDFPGSYEELSATCMIGYALARGLRLGWLDTAYQDLLRRTWQGVAARIDEDGRLVDVCTGTGVQKSLRDYLDRPAISGFDERGGALALWFAVEMAQVGISAANVA